MEKNVIFLNLFLNKLVRYEFRITASRGNFDNARDQCASMGGDLLTESMKPEGSQYHE